MNKIATKIVKDGNSMAIRIPKTALQMSGIHGYVELTVNKNEIIIKNAKSSRADWSKAIIADPATIDSELNDWEILAGESIDD